MPYLSKRALQGLKDYQYKPGNYTILDELHQPIWNYVVTLLPTWLAPNLITLMGVVWLMAAYVLTMAYIPDYTGTAPRWVYAFNGWAVFFYLHLDCLDGKQARRTKSSSPLGQLFDHGCDALSLSLVMINLVTCAQPGFSVPFIFTIVLGPAIPFILAHWEEYHTGMMLYGAGVWGVTEANYAAVLVGWWTALAGPAFWATSVVDIAPFLPDALRGWEPRHIMYVVLAGGTLQTGLPQLYRVLTTDYSNLSAKNIATTSTHDEPHTQERGHKELGRIPALFQLAQIVLMFALATLLCSEPCTNQWQPRVTSATWAMVFALQTSRLIVAHMAKDEYYLAAWPLVLMGLQVLNNLFLQVLPGMHVASVVAAVVAVGYLHYVLSVVQEICGVLGIQCLRIKPVVDQ